MVAYTKHQQRKKEESEKLRGEKFQIKFIDLRFVRSQIVKFRKQEEDKMFHKFLVLGMSDYLWDKVR